MRQSSRWDEPDVVHRGTLECRGRDRPPDGPPLETPKTGSSAAALEHLEDAAAISISAIPASPRMNPHASRWLTTLHVVKSDEPVVLERAVQRVTERAADGNTTIDEMMDAGLEGSDSLTVHMKRAGR